MLQVLRGKPASAGGVSPGPSGPTPRRCPVGFSKPLSNRSLSDLCHAPVWQIGAPTLHHPRERGSPQPRASMPRAGPKIRTEAVDTRATALARRRETVDLHPAREEVGENGAGHKRFDSSDASRPGSNREAK